MQTQGFNNLALMASDVAGRRGSRAMAFLDRAYGERLRRREELERDVNAYKQERAARKAAETRGGIAGPVMGGIGTALGVILAIPTGGMSLAAIPAMAATGAVVGGAGAALGNAFDPVRPVHGGSGYMPNPQSMYGAGEALGSLQNPYFQGGGMNTGLAAGYSPANAKQYNAWAAAMGPMPPTAAPVPEPLQWGPPQDAFSMYGGYGAPIR